MFGLYMLAIYLGVAVIGAGFVALARRRAGGGTGHASHPHEQLISGEMAMYMPVSEEVTRVSSEKTVMDWS